MQVKSFRRALLALILSVTLSCGAVPLRAQAAPSDPPKSTTFDAQYYADHYGDLKAAFGYDTAKLWNHYLAHGRREGRIPVDQAGAVQFDPVYYADTYADLRAAFGSDAVKLWNHYLLYGQYENRRPSKDYKDGQRVWYIQPKESTQSSAPAQNTAAQVAPGRRIAFVGDSITTFGGSLPKGYVPYYPSGDVDVIGDTWWYRTAAKGGYQLAVNASWSGSRLTGNTNDDTGFVGCSEARIRAVVDAKPNLVVIQIGANDYMQGIPVGTYTHENGAQPAYTGQFAYAYYTLVRRLKESLPGAKIVCCTLLPNYSVWPNKAGLTPEPYNNVIRAIASDLGVTLIDTAACALPKTDFLDGVHPNEHGSAVISDYVLQRLPALP